ncbi:MAG: adenylate/guanylate cyclase domain-containing protein [Candidatus Methylacidiphilales bacterium]
MSNDIPDKPERGAPAHPHLPEHPDPAPPPAAMPLRGSFSLPGAALDQVGKRILAAIMFTDVVNFTGRMAQDEEVTLQLVQRDMAWITQQVERHDGRVLKSTGDGLLTCFSSAHEGVNCALAVQDRLDDIARHNPSHRALHHRIAVHVGDVFVMHNDIMGDGVNVTARLLQEASPNAIILSHTVFELVKSGLSVQLSYLGAKQLKHVAMPMPVYQISPRSMKKSQMLNISPRSTALGDRPAPVVRSAYLPVGGGGAGTGVVGPAPNQQPYKSPHLPEIQANPRYYGVKLADTQRDEDAELQRAGAAMGVHMRTDADTPPPIPPEADADSPCDSTQSAEAEAESEAVRQNQNPTEQGHHSGHSHHASGIGIPNPHQPHYAPEDQQGATYQPQPFRPHFDDRHRHPQQQPGGAAWQQVRITSAIQPPAHSAEINKPAEFQQLHFGRLASPAPYRFLFDMISQLMEERGRLLEGRIEEGWIRAMWPHNGDRRVPPRREPEPATDPEEAKRHPVTGLLKALPRLLGDLSARVGGLPGGKLLPPFNPTESYVEIRFFASGFSTLVDIVPDGKHVPEYAPALLMGKRGAAGNEARADARRRLVIQQIALLLTGEPHPVPQEYFIPEPNAPRPPSYTLRKD